MNCKFGKNYNVIIWELVTYKSDTSIQWRKLKVIYIHFYFVHREALEECLRQQLAVVPCLGAQAGEPDGWGAGGGGDIDCKHTYILKFFNHVLMLPIKILKRKLVHLRIV